MYELGWLQPMFIATSGVGATKWTITVLGRNHNLNDGIIILNTNRIYSPWLFYKYYCTPNRVLLVIDTIMLEYVHINNEIN